MWILFLVVGILGLTWCLLPTFFYGILSLGNITGIIVFVCFIMIGVFFKSIIRFRDRIMEKRSGKIFIICHRVFIGLFCALVIYLSALMVIGANRKPAADSTLVVLGCLVKDYGPSLMLRERLDRAYDYLTQNPEINCVLSGGQGNDEPMSEAQAMYDYLVDRGISPERLYMEDKSMDTKQNIEYTFELVRDKGLNPKMAILSNEFHLYRAGNIAEKLDISYGTVPATTHWWMFMTYYIRELYGILGECVLGM